MNLHEYQAKRLFAEYGIPVPEGRIATSSVEAIEQAKELGGTAWVLKCQVHAGGRGKAGGVKIVHSEAEIEAFCNRWLGQRLTTYQSDSAGQPVEKILIEPCAEVAKELYLALVIDRSQQALTFIASTAGGMEIERVAKERPEALFKVTIDPLLGAQAWQGRELAFQLGLSGAQVSSFTQIFLGLAKLFVECDCALLEVNPLIITRTGDLLALDGKINLDSNALYRQPRLRSWRDEAQEDPRELEAVRWELSYVALDGDIGCMVNGAGLAMGTMDMIKLHGGHPANFLDVGGGATKERVAHAFKIILSDHNVKAVLVNIFGGIVRCDMIAEGIISAVAEVGVKVPVVVRLEGNNAPLGAEKLAQSGLNILAANSLQQAAELVVAAAKGELQP